MTKRKTCSRCRKYKSLNSFSICVRNKDGRLYTCKMCMNSGRDKKALKVYYKKNKKKIKLYYAKNKARIAKNQKLNRKKDPYKFLDTRLRSVYGISKKDFDFIAKNQKHKCKICDKKKALVVDHNHETKKVRGLLCAICNRGLGLFKENKRNLKMAIKYLEQYD